MLVSPGTLAAVEVYVCLTYFQFSSTMFWLGLQHRKQAASCVAAPFAQQRQLLPDTSKQNHEQSPCVQCSPRRVSSASPSAVPPHHTHVSLSCRVSSLSLVYHLRCIPVSQQSLLALAPYHGHCTHAAIILPLAKISQHSRCPSCSAERTALHSSQSPIAVSSARPRAEAYSCHDDTSPHPPATHAPLRSQATR